MASANQPKDTVEDHQDCPECGTRVLVHTGFVTWCHECGWNLSPRSATQPSNIHQKMYASAGGKLGHNLFAQLKDDPTLKPSFTFTKMMAFVVATVVHAVTLILALFGFWLLLRDWPNVFAILGGLLFLAIAWVLFPRMGKMPKGIVARERIPTMYQLADNVSHKLGTASIAGIVIGEQYGAAYSEVGWRREKVLYIGLPLFAVLDQQERVGVIAHELAHGANGDPLRGLYIGSALASLNEWIELFQPYKTIRGGRRTSKGPFLETNLLFFILTLPAILTAYLLRYLLARELQRAEYLADYLASRVSGRIALVSALRKLHFGSTLRRVVQTMVSSQNYEADLFDELHRTMSEVPERELERVWRIEALEITRSDNTHPPHPYRVALLDA